MDLWIAKLIQLSCLQLCVFEIMRAHVVEKLTPFLSIEFAIWPNNTQRLQQYPLCLCKVVMRVGLGRWLFPFLLRPRLNHCQRYPRTLGASIRRSQMQLPTAVVHVRAQ